MGTVSLSFEAARSLAVDCLLSNGCDENNAVAIAGNMMMAERDLCPAHGLFRLPWHVTSLKSGRVNGKAKPSVETLAPSVVRVRGDRGFAPLGLEIGRGPLGAAARKTGIAAMAFVDTYHIAALWPEVEALAMEGLVAFAFTASLPYVAPAGGKKSLYGTNPMAFAWPRQGRPPLVFDQASAVMARGDVMILAREGKQVPDGVGIDSEGRPTTDPNAILEGAQLAFGGHKGASLALMVELLAGPLIGEFLSFEAEEEDAGTGAAPRGGELILALDPTRFGDPAGFSDHAERLFDAILSQEGTRLPGARRFESRKKTIAAGISLPRTLHETILSMTRSA